MKFKSRRHVATVSGNRPCRSGACLLPMIAVAMVINSSLVYYVLRERYPSYALLEEETRNFSSPISQERDAEPSKQKLVFRNYTFPLGSWDNSSLAAYKHRQSLPDPMQLIEQYITWHGEQALRANPNNRLFIVAYYGCPNSFGNRMHEFLDNLQWALITNRTLLYKYMDTPTCFSIQTKIHIGDNQCQHIAESCDGFLQRAAWMPSFDTWSTLLQLPNVQFLPKDVWGHWKDAYSQKPVVWFPHPLLVSKRPGFIRNMHENTLPVDWVPPIRKLYSLGPTFAYGMMFRYSFDFAPAMKTTPISGVATPDTVFSIGLHSRHTKDTDDGCNVKAEMKCVDELLGSTTLPCHISLMSDRSCTLQGLQTRLGEKCAMRIAEHDLGSSLLSEHGPFAGAGFIQDLYLASSTVHSAVIGTQLWRGQFRSSSTVLLELVDFYSKWEAHCAGNDPSRVIIHQCLI